MAKIHTLYIIFLARWHQCHLAIPLFVGYDVTQKEHIVLMVEPGKHPKVTKIKDDLDSLQKAVSIGADYQGLIEFENFATESRRPVIGGKGVQHPVNRRYGL